MVCSLEPEVVAAIEAGRDDIIGACKVENLQVNVGGRWKGSCDYLTSDFQGNTKTTCLKEKQKRKRVGVIGAGAICSLIASACEKGL